MASGSTLQRAAAFSKIVFFCCRRIQLGSSPDLLVFGGGRGVSLPIETYLPFFFRGNSSGEEKEERVSEGRDGA